MILFYFFCCLFRSWPLKNKCFCYHERNPGGISVKVSFRNDLWIFDLDSWSVGCIGVILFVVCMFDFAENSLLSFCCSLFTRIQNTTAPKNGRQATPNFDQGISGVLCVIVWVLWVVSRDGRCLMFDVRYVKEVLTVRSYFI